MGELEEAQLRSGPAAGVHAPGLHPVPSCPVGLLESDKMTPLGLEDTSLLW